MAAQAQSQRDDAVSQTKLGKGNFGIAKLIKGDDLPSKISFLHITPSHTEITNGHYFVRVKNAEDGPSSLDTLLSPEDAVNIASSLKKKDFVTNIIPAIDEKSVQVEFNTGEIRILPIGIEAYPDTHAATPKEKPVLRISLNPEYIASILSSAFKGQDSITMELFGADKAVRIIAGPDPDEPEVEAVLMPRRI